MYKGCETFCCIEFQKHMQSWEQIVIPHYPTPHFPTIGVNDPAFRALHSAKKHRLLPNQHLLKFAE